MVVYTSCKSESVRLFENKKLNSLFGLPLDHVIPNVCIENPLVAIFNGSNRGASKEKDLKKLVQTVKMLRGSFFDKIQ